MNLLLNASDAMSQGGPIKLSTYYLTVDKEEARGLHPLLTAGRYVVLKVSDSGSGIPVGVKERIFDPFFTTKTKGKNSGLGLAVVYGIVKDYHGQIGVETQEGEGTTFSIFFPLD